MWLSPDPVARVTVPPGGVDQRPGVLTCCYRRLFGEGDVEETEPIMPGEDFAFYCLKVSAFALNAPVAG